MPNTSDESPMGTPNSAKRRVGQLQAAACFAAADSAWIMSSLAALAETIRAGALPAEIAADLRVLADAIDARCTDDG
ncbi:MAG TPA: hypothetical protein VLL76_04430 [Candidatus Omnitrophota bacterium]|nr:hypothetical protein [Candidatus Omnitrophota bacterium]